MFTLTWGLLTLKGAFLGNIKPLSRELVQSGPYQYTRHPIFLSMVVSTLGLTFGMRSMWGMVVTIFLFGVISIIRARLEEDELAKIHGEDWEEYVKKTSFIFPFHW
jgi:protein-S-isoprenylcysteine O-methyltransferase Ste14